MSNIYIQEPPTSGKILLTTTVGDIEIELWSKEAPLASRNFVQLCMEGYYNQTIFHRLVPGFVVQGGDPTGTGFSDETIYGAPFRDEPHSRLRFMRRGLLATANSGEKNTNGSQFFFTLDATPDLQNKHTIFGKVVGNTLYNMTKLGESEVDANDRPLFVNKIIKTEVLVNPFDDIVPRILGERDADKGAPQVESKSKATKNFGLLSFGLEAEEEEEEIVAASSVFQVSSKSSHDIANDPALSAESALSECVPVSDRAPIVDTTPTMAEVELKGVQQKLKSSTKSRNLENSSTTELPAGKSAASVEQLRLQALQLQKDLTKPKEVLPLVADAGNKAEEAPAVQEYKQQLDQYESRRRLPATKVGTDREAKALARLNAFKSKLLQSRSSDETTVDSPAAVEASAEDDDIKGTNWMKHKLTFEAEEKIARDANTRDAKDWYDYTDPRNPMTKRRHEAKDDSKKKSKSHHDEKL
ncbi:Peptidyl-prolyl cis-trans isomerase CWC27-like protein [Hypsibius exemplaris]|uniref:Spliceosome-associated protein CWC27 homolog n=1 Tax=Hypsibius exemplaris TaxID=2072580 RepID=A0A9X6RNA3_HYPEX|nr:Peptidyl-prolyl cis-trans isomerase CWC27-like protein [Hypsibius exemplaris]